MESLNESLHVAKETGAADRSCPGTGRLRRHAKERGRVPAVYARTNAGFRCSERTQGDLRGRASLPGRVIDASKEGGRMSESRHQMDRHEFLWQYSFRRRHLQAHLHHRSEQGGTSRPAEAQRGCRGRRSSRRLWTSPARRRSPRWCDSVGAGMPTAAWMSPALTSCLDWARKNLGCPDLAKR